jgi:hypothetical protein
MYRHLDTISAMLIYELRKYYNLNQIKAGISSPFFFFFVLFCFFYARNGRRQRKKEIVGASE